MPLWLRLRNLSGAAAFVNGANAAAVVGLLAAALWDPVIRSAVLAPADVAIALAGFLGLQALRIPPLAMIPLIIAASLAATLQSVDRLPSP